MRKPLRRRSLLGLGAATAALTVGLGAAAASPALAFTSGTYSTIKNAPHQRCLDVRSEDGLTSEGARLQLYHCTGASEQQYEFFQAYSNSGPVPNTYQIRPKSDPSMCLVADASHDVFSGAFTASGAGAEIAQHECFTYQAQNWTVVGSRLVNTTYNMCLDVDGDGGSDHQPVMIWACDGNLIQAWDF